jgi:RecA-family ATPase
MSALSPKWAIPLDQLWSVIPVRARDKRPAIGQWREYQLEPAAHETVAQWAANDTLNAGIVTGAVSGLIVLDLDNAEAIAEAEKRGLPETVTVQTGKGRHVYFRHCGGQVSNRAGLFPGADLRGDGGFVVAPGSVHPSGAVYRWLASPETMPLADPPAWLLALIDRSAPMPPPEPPHAPQQALQGQPGHVDSPEGVAALDAECLAIRRAGAGRQESTLNAGAFKVGALVASGALTVETARRELIAAGMAMPNHRADPWDAGLIESKVDRALADGSAETGTDVIACLDWAALASVSPEQTRFVIPKLAPAGEVTLFTGAGSAGKSLLAQQLATALAAGVPTLGIEMGQAPAIYLTAEETPKALHWRQAHINAALGLDMANQGPLYCASLRGRLDNAICGDDGRGRVALLPGYHRLAALIRRTGAAFVALDNIAHLFTGNENDRGDVTQFANALNRLAGETGAAIILLGHPNKAFGQGHREGNGFSGSTAWINAVRSQFLIEHDLDTDVRTITLGKANYARKGEALRMVWHDWAFMREDDLPPDHQRDHAATVKAAGENLAFLRCLAKATSDRRNVSHQPGSNYAPKVFAGMPEGKGFKANAFAAAMERLLSLGKIELDADLWPGPNRHPKRGIRETLGGEV